MSMSSPSGNEMQGQAEELLRKINNQRNRIAGGYDIPADEPGPIALITQALRAEREKALEEAAGIADKVVAERTVQLRGVHVEPIKGWIECKLSEAQRIAQAIRGAVVKESLTPDQGGDANNMVDEEETRL